MCPVWKRFKTSCFYNSTLINRGSGAFASDLKIIQQDKSNVIASEQGRARQSSSGFYGLLRHSIPRNDNRVFAFTLAEVLITLVIIGVIAALTIPTIIQKTQKLEYVAGLKKAYSVLSQATNVIIAENGSPKASSGGWASSAEAIYEQYKQHLNNLKECKFNRGCFEQFSAGQYKYLNGNLGTDNAGSYSHHARLMLEDGAQVLFTEIASSDWLECNYNGKLGANSKACGMIIVDINGAKRPNQTGRDMFYFLIKENGLFPRGCDNDYSSCKINDTGEDCACKVLREGNMNY